MTFSFSQDETPNKYKVRWSFWGKKRYKYFIPLIKVNFNGSAHVFNIGIQITIKLIRTSLKTKIIPAIKSHGRDETMTEPAFS